MWKKNPQPTLQYSRRPSHDLFECIEQSEHKRLSEEQARYIFAQVVDAVHYLDSHGISHRDIKDENIAIDKDLRVSHTMNSYHLSAQSVFRSNSLTSEVR